MKKKFFYIAMVALALTGCSDSLSTIGSSDDNSEITIPADAEAGELLIKFKPEMTDILDRTMTRAAGNGGVMTRSGIPSTDEVLEILGGYHFERIFPVDSKNEERTRIGTGQQPHQARLQPQKPSELCEPGSPATAGSHPKRSSGRKIL